MWTPHTIESYELLECLRLIKITAFMVPKAKQSFVFVFHFSPKYGKSHIKRI